MPSPMDSSALRALRGESDFPPAPVDSDDPLVGSVIAERYRVVRKLGEGAQASVYVAKHTLIKRLVALKVLSSEMSADRDLVQRFLDEGQVAGTMKHTNIVESLDMGVTDDGRPYLVLEYLEGPTIADEVYHRGALDLGRAAFIGVQIASALAAAHARGIVHRDLKPENVILIDHEDHGDHAKVLDFGISKLESRKEAAARATLVMGTPDYMAPEQVSDPSSVDARADVFALGAMLYEMLSGRSPLAVEDGEDVLDVVLRCSPPPLGELRPDLPPPVLAAVERAMHKDRSKRMQTIAELGAELGPFAVVSPPTSPASSPSGPGAVSIPSLAKISGVQSIADPVAPRIPGPAPLPQMSPPSSSPLLHGPASSPYGVASSDGAVRADERGFAARSGPSRLGVIAAVIAALFVGGGAMFLLLRPHASTIAAPATLAVDGTSEATARRGAERPRAPVAEEPEPAGALAAALTAAAPPPEEEAAITPARRERRPTAPAPKAARAAGQQAVAADPPSGTAPEPKADARRAEPPASAAALAAPEAAGAAPAATPAPAAEPAAPPEPAAPAPARTAVVPFGEGMTRPSPINPADIQYTREAREARVSGVIIARCTITTEGTLQNCRILKSVPLMDRAVLDALARHRGKPVMYQGKPVSVEYTYTIHLKLPQ